jgi:hypothetical protein
MINLSCVLTEFICHFMIIRTKTVLTALVLVFIFCLTTILTGLHYTSAMPFIGIKIAYLETLKLIKSN